ncbi:MAG: DUF1801 domain-containing protein [Pelagimonas sp.]|uniref:DUF1801 domain-containing protein n=1 Tax=Pelagimonas sp. TaxID=2073170 RepID=UPI003D6A5977
MTQGFPTAQVAAAFDAFPAGVRPELVALRTLILDVAADTPGVGAIEETLKWGQPSYHTAQTKSGTPLRLGVPKSGGSGLFVHCQTRLISDFQAQFPNGFRYDGTRALLFDQGAKVPKAPLGLFISRALTYHQR